MAGIKQPGDLGNITSHGDKVIFGSQSLHSLSAVIDVTQSPPSIQQTMQQVQHYDQQQTHMMNQIHAQNAQLNQQAPTR